MKYKEKIERNAGFTLILRNMPRSNKLAIQSEMKWFIHINNEN